MPSTRGSYLPTPLQSAQGTRCAAALRTDEPHPLGVPGEQDLRSRFVFPTDRGGAESAGAEEAFLGLTRPVPPRPQPSPVPGACALLRGV